jgi:hypothetical protein
MEQTSDSCVHYDMPGSWTQLLRNALGEHSSEVSQRARDQIRSNTDFTWRVHSTVELIRPQEVRKALAGLVFVGDSQVREIAWAALKWFAPSPSSLHYHVQGRRSVNEDNWGCHSNQAKVYPNCTNRLYPHCPGVDLSGTSKEDTPVTGLHHTCVPRGIGRYGWTAACAGTAGTTSDSSCSVHSPLETQPAASLCAQVNQAQWDGQLHVSERVCESDFFVTYIAMWGATAVDPASLPRCLHAPGGTLGRTARDENGIEHFRRVVWVVNGAPLHALAMCSDARLLEGLPETVLARFPQALRRTVVWQTASASNAQFVRQSVRRHERCSDALNHTPSSIADAERRWLRDAGAPVQSFDYHELTRLYAPLLSDGRHFTYYFHPCNRTFPELAMLAARMAMQAALGQPVEACSLEGSGGVH